MDITIIVSRSFQLYKQNWRKFLVLGAIAALVSVVIQGLTMPLEAKQANGLTSLVYFVLCPVMVFGFYRYFIKQWRGESPLLSEFLHYCHVGKAYGKALWFYFCYFCCNAIFFILVVILFFICIMLMGPLWILNPTFLLLPIILLGIPSLWFCVRMQLSLYLFVLQEQGSPWQIIKEGFTRMKGHVQNLIMLQLLMFLFSLIYVVPNFIVTQHTALETLPESSAFLLFSFVVQTILSPLGGIMIAGFASELLQDLTWEGEIVADKENIDE